MLQTLTLALAIIPSASGHYQIQPQYVEHNGESYYVSYQGSQLSAVKLTNNEVEEVKPQVITQGEAPEGDYYSQIKYWCSHYGCNPSTLYNRMQCESSGNPNARNGIYIGLFQYGHKTFYAYAPRTTIVNPNIYNPEHQIQLATYMHSIGEPYHWPNC